MCISQFHTWWQFFQVEPLVFYVVLFDLDDSNARFSRPDSADGRVNDDFHPAIKGKTAGISVKMAAKDFPDAW